MIFCHKWTRAGGGVLKHTLLVCKRMDYVLSHLEKAFPKFAKQLTPFAANKPLLKMTALLHDIAKPATAKMHKGRLRFFYHEQQGARMARNVLDQLHYSKADTRLICAMIISFLPRFGRGGYSTLIFMLG